MSIKKKFGMALATTALGAMLIGGGTFALFSGTASNEGNTFTAGTVAISSVTAQGKIFAGDLYFDNLAPGDSGTKTLTIKNNGSLDAWVKLDGYTHNGEGTLDPNNKKAGDLFIGSNPLTLQLDSKFVRVPANGGEASFNVSYSFPSAAGNEYQGTSGSATIKVKAVQARNNTNATEDGPISWD